jgi:hypothetical protein
VAKKKLYVPNIAHQINLAKQSLDSTPAWIRGDESVSVVKQSASGSSNSPAAGPSRTARAKAR